MGIPLFAVATLGSQIAEKKAKTFLQSGKKQKGLFDLLALQTTAFPRTTADPTALIIEANHLSSVEAWEEYKGRLEDNKNIPEEELDELETCITGCFWNDNWKD